MNAFIECRIGDMYPFRVTLNSSKKLVKAIASCGAQVLASGVDSTCPAIHAVFHFKLPKEKLSEFRRLIDHKLERIEEITGQ